MANAMEPFFVLRPDPAREDVFFEDYQASEPYDDGYWKGEPLVPDAPAELRHAKERARTPDMLAGVFQFPVVSPRFREALAAAGAEAEVEYHPVRVVNTATGQVDESYRMMNVLDNVPCLDRERSVVESYGDPDFVASIERLALRLEPLQGRRIARMDEYPVLLLVSDALRARLQETGITGIEILAPEQYGS